MDVITNLLPLIKIFAAFGSMLIGIRLRLGLGTSILCGAGLTMLFFNLPLDGWPSVVTQALTNEKTLFLGGIVALIMVLSGLLEKTGQSARLMDSLTSRLHSPRLRLIFFPALIGLLPMPGGAVFSAPMVDSVSKDMNLPAEDKVLINYWFRHIWELGWPLYPGIILSASLADIPIYRIISYTCPAIAVMLVLGWFFVLRPGRLNISIQPKNGDQDGAKDHGSALFHGLPLITAIAGAIGLEVVIALLAPEIAFEWGVITALGAAILCSVLQNKGALGPIRSILASRHLYSMLYVIVAIFIFKEAMQVSGVVTQLSMMAGGGVALFSAAVILPFLVGLIAGINVAFVGSTFPLMFALLTQMGLSHQFLPYLVLGQVAGFAGVMVSPIHICFILTCQYFSVDLGRAWKRLAVPCAIFLCLGGLYFLLLRSYF